MPSSADPRYPIRPRSSPKRLYTPIAGVLTHNRYTYVNGDPINLVDPTRHRSQAVIDEEYLQCVYILQFQLN